MKYMEQARAVSQEQIAEGIFSLILQTEKIASSARPGQFVSVYCAQNSRLLPRPISICDADPAAGQIRLVYRVAGKGTEEFSALRAGGSIRILGPLGNGFPLERMTQEKTALLVGGGIGIPPMLALARALPGNKEAVLGFRDRQFLTDDLKKYANVRIATEDGSAGTKGNVLDVIRGEKLKADVIYACGPTPMLRALAQYAGEHRIECYVSLEERMACGIGACLACVCKTRETDEHSRVNNRRICADGPVFRTDEIIL